MPRRARQAPGGLLYHVLNRAVGRMRLFSKDADYIAFQQVVLEAQKHLPVPMLGYCLMPNHWHFIFWPRADGELSRFMHWMTMTHTQRWRHHRGLVGLGPLYQGRFKAFPIEEDIHLLTVLRYVERNPLRAKLVQRAQDWRFTSLHDRMNEGSLLGPLLHHWPIEMPSNYLELVNRPQTAAEEEAMRTGIHRGKPFGDSTWTTRMVEQLDLQSSMNLPHRPKRKTGKDRGRKEKSSRPSFLSRPE